MLYNYSLLDADGVAAVVEAVPGCVAVRTGAWLACTNHFQSPLLRPLNRRAAHSQQRLPPLEAWAYDPRLTQPMETFVGHAEPELFTEKLNLKRPRLGGANPMHQDYPYWVDVSDDATQIATTIIFLDDSTVDNGCLWVIPGSHQQGKWTTRDDGDEFAHNEVDEASYPDATAVPVQLTKGSTLSFGAFLVHKSAQNLSEENRRTLLFSYQPPGRRRQVDSVRNWIARTPG